ncbi:hypothetical protein [Piscinibacter sp. HJYY11]|uniref:hypothetical protein n=1 Tax=Piscinibacter sp. HJYY11 TaxID=2801333 RepID=UPI00191F6452|nr:hypothetical protein [Piscinibacter sp. HJYY11]MBL0726553.1 hypothetical protein [Piscinibacter sp. HJYY11]
MKRLSIALAAALTTAGAVAAPMGFKDSTMLMADFSPNWRESWVNHALTARDAIGIGGLYMRSDDETRSRTLAEATYTRLAKRWNLEHAQANVWLFAGAGAIRGNDFSGTRFAWAPGLQLDYETTRLYLAGTARLYRAEGLNHDFGSVRAGFSFYEVDYDEVQPWLVVEARRMRGLSEKIEVTPMLRLIHNRYFVELGVNTDKQARANFMYTF